MGDAWSPQDPATTAEPVLELRPEGLNCPTANGRASLSHRLIVQMAAMVLKVVYFPFHDLLGFGGALGWAFKQLFQAPDDSRFLPMTQIMEKLFDPLFGLVRAFPVQSVTHRPEVLARMMKVQSLDRAGKAVLSQIPEPDRPIHYQIDVTGSTQSPAACLGLHRRPKVNRRRLGWAGHNVLLQQQTSPTLFLDLLLQTVNDRRFDLIPLHPLGLFPTRRGSPIRPSFSRHPAVHHNHQTKLRLAGRQARRRQFQLQSGPASLLHVLMNQVIAHGAAPASGHLGGPLVRADFGGGIAQACLQFRTHPLVGFHAPSRPCGTNPLAQSDRVTVADAQFHHPRPPQWSFANPASAFRLSLGPSWDKPLPGHPRPPATAAPNAGASIPGPPPTPSVPSGAAGSTITSTQRIEVDVFDRHPRAMLAVLTAAPLGLAHALPIGRPVAGADKTLPFDERFQPPQAMAVLSAPVAIDTPSDPAQYVAGQVGHPYPRQDQESSVVGNLAQPLRPLLPPPPQGPVPWPAAPSRRTEEQAGQFPPTLVLDQIADIFPHHPQPQVMIPIQIKGPGPLFRGARPH